MGSWLHRWWPALLLGLATIGAYGTAYYAIGVLIPVIAADTGWSAGMLSAGFSIGVLSQGAIALLAGRLFDRYGPRPVLLPAILLGSLAFAAASQAASVWQFVAFWALGGAAIGGGLYYNVTMPVTARLYPGQRAAAFSVLTLRGALASPIFYPLAAWLIDSLGWRSGLLALVAAMALCVLPAALLIGTPPPSQRDVVARAGRASLRLTLLEPPVHRAILFFALGAFANAALVLHQVSIMEAAGLSLAAASAYAGVRGFFQIPGRLFLTPLTRRIGVAGAIGLCYVTAASGVAALLLALGGGMSQIAMAYFVVASGVSLGLLSPLNGLFQAEVFGDARLGTLSGVTL